MPFITVIGKTGTGKSFLCNHLGQARVFLESNRMESCTSDIQIAPAFLLGDIIADTPGHMDSHGHAVDMVNQAKITDYLKDKTSRVVLFVFTDRMDAFTQAALRSVQQSRVNVLLVRNKVLGDQAELEEFEGLPVYSIRAHENDFEPLKDAIRACTPMKPAFLVQPTTLFPIPLTQVTTDIVPIFKERRTVDVVRPMKRSVPVTTETTSKQRRGGMAGAAGGKKKVTTSTTSYQEVTEDQVVPVLHNVFTKYQITKALRFDGCIGVLEMLDVGEKMEEINGSM
jgi:hypothetical protein